MTDPKIRAVRIRTVDNAHFVEYVIRKKFGKKLAAAFDARDNHVEYVQNWVHNQDHLVLLP